MILSLQTVRKWAWLVAAVAAAIAGLGLFGAQSPGLDALAAFRWHAAALLLLAMTAAMWPRRALIVAALAPFLILGVPIALALRAPSDTFYSNQWLHNGAIIRKYAGGYQAEINRHLTDARLIRVLATSSEALSRAAPPNHTRARPGNRFPAPAMPFLGHTQRKRTRLPLRGRRRTRGCT